MRTGEMPAKILDSDWSSFEDNHTRHLKHLVENPQSPFYLYTKPSLSRILQSCGASIAHVPAKPEGDNKTEGYVLFRQLKPLQHVYLIATGAVVFYTFCRDYAKQRAPEPKLYEKVEIDTLVDSYQYMGTVGPGQTAGLLEMYIYWLSRNKTDSPRLHAINRAHLYELAGNWFLSGFIATNSLIIRIPIDAFIQLIEDEKRVPPSYKTKFASLVQYSNGVTVDEMEQTAFIRRCGEELSLRQSQWLSRLSLIERGYLDAVIAYDLYLYGQRKKASLDSRSSKVIDHIRANKKKLIWHSGVGEHDFDKAFTTLRELEPPLFTRPYEKANKLENLDLDGLLAYYLKRLTTL